MNYKQEIEQLEKIIKEQELKKATLNKELEMNIEQKDVITQEIKAQGVEPSDVDNVIKKLESELTETIQSAKVALGLSTEQDDEAL
jgi:septal ring factor EnvC (AmiA/AmiB activator)